ncbi:MAG: glycosyltransferase [Deltaproteobacteria bacterium]|nr:glycosyltransferase [Deltaproteobacteria bacterium]
MTPPLSIIIAARDPWPALRECVDALYPQAIAIGAEIVIAVSGAHTLPPEPRRRYPAITWLEELDGSVFSLRALALAHTHADIVAITEDHAWVTNDWCRRILEAHAGHPEAAAIGGVVENGATGTLIDRASFFVANGPFMRPIANGVVDTISLQANVSYKRRALPARLPPLGFMQMTFNRDLSARGETLVADDRLVVQHVQALDWRRHSAGHFHNGRSIAAFRLERMSSALRLLRALGCFVLPPVMLGRTLWTIGAKRRYARDLVTAVPAMIWLLCCHAMGELFGYVAGPGDSPRRVA